MTLNSYCFCYIAIIQIVLLLPFALSQEWSYEDDGCRTPDRGVGTCIVIKQCQPIVAFINNAKRPLSPSIIATLKQYQCGFEGSSVKVCCPPGPISANSNANTSPTPPPDVSSHKNINLLPTDCGIAPSVDRIINGNKTSLFEFPWMALLSYNSTRSGPVFRCGGSILNDRYILTAAHCITNIKLPLIGVRVGEHDIRTAIDCEDEQDGLQICAPPVQDLAIEEVIPHAGYNSSVYVNDIGLLRVAKMNLSVDSVRPICLPLDDAKNYNFTNRNVIVTGWGATETGRSSPDLLKVQIPIIPMESCRKTYASQVPITFRQMCAGGRNRQDSCGGDSGGPLHVVSSLFDDIRFIQQGIVSFGPKNCGLEGNPGVYTRTAYYMDWILDNIKN